MFQISRRVDYAVRIMLALGQTAEGEWARAASIARKMLIPLPFLHKITADLVQAGLVATRPGPAGGLALALPAPKVTLLRIVEAIDGPVCINVCLVRPGECPRDTICPAHTFWAQLQSMITNQLRGATLDALIGESRLLEKRPRTQSELVELLTDPVKLG